MPKLMILSDCLIISSAGTTAIQTKASVSSTVKQLLNQHILEHSHLQSLEKVPSKNHPASAEESKLRNNLDESNDILNHQLVHTGEKPYTCKFCPRSFVHGSSLLCHERTHTGERPYTCKICPKAFALSSTLRIHERTHSEFKGIKPSAEHPYYCPICSKTFKCNSGLKNHKKAIHEGQKFMCQTCGKSYVNKGGLQFHIGIEIQKLLIN